MTATWRLPVSATRGNLGAPLDMLKEEHIRGLVGSGAADPADLDFSCELYRMYERRADSFHRFGPGSGTVRSSNLVTYCLQTAQETRRGSRREHAGPSGSH